MLAPLLEGHVAEVGCRRRVFVVPALSTTDDSCRLRVRLTDELPRRGWLRLPLGSKQRTRVGRGQFGTWFRLPLQPSPALAVRLPCGLQYLVAGQRSPGGNQRIQGQRETVAMARFGRRLSDNTLALRQAKLLPHRDPCGDCRQRGWVGLERRSLFDVFAVGDPDEFGEGETELDVSTGRRS